MEALVVSEDPDFICRVARTMRTRGSKVVGCLGPVNNPCPLDTEGRCALAEHADVVIVDAPSGLFKHLSAAVPAGSYAGHLRAACPHSLVILETPDFQAGPTGGTPHVSSRSQAIALLKALAPVKEWPLGEYSFDEREGERDEFLGHVADLVAKALNPTRIDLLVDKEDG
jgi:hypothetical protein